MKTRRFSYPERTWTEETLRREWEKADLEWIAEEKQAREKAKARREFTLAVRAGVLVAMMGLLGGLAAAVAILKWVL